MEEKILDAQRQQWQGTFSEMPGMFGDEPSDPARKAAEKRLNYWPRDTK